MVSLRQFRQRIFHSTCSISSQTILAWISMIAAVFAGAAIGPMFKYMEAKNITPCLAASWRCQIMTLFLIPAALMEKYFYSISSSSIEMNPNHVNWMTKKDDLSFPIIVHILFAGIGWAANLLFWVIALQYTTTVQASIFTSVHPLMLLLYFYFMNKKRISIYEWVGVITSFIGMIVAAFHTEILGLLSTSHSTESSTTTNTNANTTNNNSTSSTSNMNNNWKYELLGNSLCIISSMAEVVVMLNRLKLKKYVPLFQVR